VGWEENRLREPRGRSSPHWLRRHRGDGDFCEELDELCIVIVLLVVRWSEGRVLRMPLFDEYYFGTFVFAIICCCVANLCVSGLFRVAGVSGKFHVGSWFGFLK